MVMNTPFTTASPLLATYSYSDISTGTGYNDYLAFVADASAGKTYHLTKETPRSVDIETVITRLNAVNFDSSEFKITQTVSGQIIITGSYAYVVGGGGNEGRLKAGVYRWDGSTETLIGEIYTATWGANDANNFTFSITASDTIFEIGDILRLKITHDQVAYVGGVPTLTIGTDPQNRDGSVITPSSADRTTQLKLSTPFNIQE